MKALFHVVVSYKWKATPCRVGREWTYDMKETNHRNSPPIYLPYEMIKNESKNENRENESESLTKRHNVLTTALA